MKSEHNIAFGVVLKRLRLEKKWTQETLGFEAHFSRPYISRLEAGKQTPTLDTLMALCAIFALGLHEIAIMVVDEMGRNE